MGADSNMIAAAPRDAAATARAEAETGAAAPAELASPARPRPSWFALRGRLPAIRYRMLAVAGFAALFGVWVWASHRESVNPVFVPAPEAVWQAARELFGDEKLWLDLKLSVFRVTAGFVLAGVVGVPLGLWMGSFEAVEAVVQPIVEFVRYVPVPALIPILMVIFGIDEPSKIALIWVGTFFQLVLMVADEVRRVPNNLLQVSYTLGARRGEVIRRVLWPAARPGIFDALRLCNGWAWTYVVVAELVAANEGLGYRILKFSRFLQTPQMWAYVILLGLIGLALDAAFRALNRRLFHWAETAR
ncbi:MAG TPA: ABC transporter permease [Polyangia bacterium]|nr:ABC transporter permease [Polyangia bacterium]